MMNILKRIEMLRQDMEMVGFHAYIITGSDPHGCEVPPQRWQTRKWISGFSGSAGTFVATAKTSGLWTDGRYWLQAEQQLAGTGIQLFKTGDPNVPPLEEWLVRTLPADSTVGVDGQSLSARMAEDLGRFFSAMGIHLDASRDILEEIWTDRPPAPHSSVVELTVEETGKSRMDKLKWLRTEMHKQMTNVWLATALDSIAWLLNIRGNDIPNTPIALGYLIVNLDNAVWYTNTDRVPKPIIESLKKDGILILPTDHFLRNVAVLPLSSRILLDKSCINYAAVSRFPDGTVQMETTDPVYTMKARKNPVELASLRQAMSFDGVAMVRFFMDVETRLANGQPVDELMAVELLYNHRAAMPGFLGNSFSTIVAAGENSAICHYIPSTEHNARIDNPESTVLLVDSGAQWVTGTTDLTRMMALKPPTDTLCRDYTLVLKAHIAVSRLTFPVQTRGYQIDAIARYALWMQGIDYGHGTGHGVGFRLGVHEGPQVISPKPIDVYLELGMVVSNEPGLYRKDQYGIRIENMLVCQEGERTSFGHFYRFETLTLAPYCKSLIDCNLLNADEIEWINTYHAMIKNKLTPLLNSKETEWLCRATSAIQK